MNSTSPLPHKLERDHWHRYTCHEPTHTQCAGKVYRSVTTILNKAVPKDLSWWGMTIGAEAAKELVARGYDIGDMTDEALVEAIKQEKLTVQDRMRARGDSGTAVHAALEDYGEHGTIPKLADFPREDWGYVQGLAKFFMTFEPEIVASEVQVVSVEHEFAGTYDFEARIKARLVNGKWTSVGGPGTTFILGDLKTSKWVYPTSHFPQLEAYEQGRVENGREPTEARAVVHVTATGGMNLVPSTFTFADFLTLKASAAVVDRGEREGRALRKATT